MAIKLKSDFQTGPARVDRSIVIPPPPRRALDFPGLYEPCRCRNCRGAAIWPRTHYVGSRGIAFDCWYEMHAPPAEPRINRRVTVKARDVAGELSYRSSAHVWRDEPRWVAGCEGPCSADDGRAAGLRPVRRRYCVSCAAIMRRQLLAAGWSPARIEAWNWRQDCLDWSEDEVRAWWKAKKADLGIR